MIDNFDQLVMRCEKARQRRILRLSFMIVGSILFVIAGIGGYQMWSTSQNAPITVEKVAVAQEKNSTVHPVSSANTPVNKTYTPAAPTKTETTIIPIAAKTAPTAAFVASTPATATIIKPDTAASTPPAVVAPIAKNNRLFEVNTQTSDTPLEAYQNNPKYETALAVARDYYAKQNFADAATWAKKANQMNREAEEAWLLYAKSYYAQGRKSEAIGVLELYLNYKDSKAASELLRTWKLNTTN